MHPGEAADALAEIHKWQQQVINRAIVPVWYWLRDGLLDGRGVMAILGFVALIVGCSLGLAFRLRAAGASYSGEASSASARAPRRG